MDGGCGVIFFNLQGRRSGEEVVLKRRLALHLNCRVMERSERICFEDYELVRFKHIEGD